MSENISDPMPIQAPDFVAPTVVVPHNISEKDQPIFKTEYTNKVIGFVDIKGFKSFISQSQSDPSKVITMYEAISQLRLGQWVYFLSFFDINEKIEEPEIKLTSFSDCTVITCDLSEGENCGYNESYIVYLIAVYAKTLLERGFLTRGGISVGKCFHYTEDSSKPDMIFGPAMLEAYDLEHIHAKDPRVILHKKAKDHFDKLSDRQKYILSTIISKDADGPNYIDPFSYVKIEKNISNKKIVSEKISKLIRDGLSNFHHNPSIYSNYKWMREKFNHCLPSELKEYKIEDL